MQPKAKYLGALSTILDRTREQHRLFNTERDAMSHAPSKSLQELSASKALEHVMKKEHSEALFRDLEALQQELLFSHVIKECKRLREIEEKHRVLRNSIKYMRKANRFVHGLHWGHASEAAGSQGRLQQKSKTGPA